MPLRGSFQNKTTVSYILVGVLFLATGLVLTELWTGLPDSVSSYIPGPLRHYGEVTLAVHDELYADLLDDTVIIRTPAQNIVDLESSRFGEWSIVEISNKIEAGTPFNITIKCDPSIIGQIYCTPQYAINFRGPIAYSIPTNSHLYAHNPSTGVTVITCNLPHSGTYEIWAWPDYIEHKGCPKVRESEVPPMVQGSGQLVVRVEKAKTRDVRYYDSSRPCSATDYRTPVAGRWVSVGHIAEKHQGTWWAQAQISRSESVYSSNSLPGYVWLPYQCKRRPLDYKRGVEEIKNLRHLAFLGDSILRTSLCGHLYRALHGGVADGPCTYSKSKTYQQSDKTFAIQLNDSSDARSEVRFTQHFVDSEVGRSLSDLDVVKESPEPVSHIITNIGMWFGNAEEEGYSKSATELLERIVEVLGTDVRITWLHTVSISTGIFCYENGMKRSIVRKHRDWANKVLASFQERHPEVRLNVIDPYPVMDGRPETSSDGRHWVKEDKIPSLSSRPHVGAADDAMMEWVWDAWLSFYLEEAAALGTA